MRRGPQAWSKKGRGKVQGAVCLWLAVAGVSGAQAWGATITVGSGQTLNVGSNSGTTTSGFSGFTSNGAAVINGGATSVTLASGASSTAGSVWTTASQTITNANGFTAAFTYTASGAKADEGITFTLQAAPAGAAALGNSLGYSGITKSVSYQLNLLGTVGSIVNVNGATGSTGGAAYNATTPVDATTGDAINVILNYANGNLVELLKDTVTGDMYAYGYAVDINSVLGGTSGRFGFTGSTLGGTTHTVSNFTFTQGPSSAPTTSGDALIVQAGGAVIGAGGTLTAPTWTISGGAVILSGTTATFNSFTQSGGFVAMGPQSLSSGKSYDVQGGSNEVTSMSVSSGGSFSLSGGLFSTASFSDTGTLSWTGGTFRYTGASALSLAPSTLGVNLTLSGTMRLESTGLNVPTGAVLTLNGGAVSTGTLTSAGSIVMTSGFLEIRSQDLGIQSGGLLGATVTVASPMTINLWQNLQVGSAGTLNIAGGFFCAGFSNSGHISVTNAGTLSATAASTNTGTLTINNGSLDLGAGANGLTNTGTLSLTDTQISGDLQSQAGASVTTAGNTQIFGTVSVATTIAASGTLTFNFGAHTLGAITGSANIRLVGSGTVGSISANGLFISNNNAITASAGTSKVSGLTIDGSTNAWTATLNISNNKLIVEATSGTKLAMRQTLENQAYFGRSNGFGITSNNLPTNTMVAVIDNGALAHPLSTFGGVAVDSNSILVAPELGGDANLDGKVDLTDLTILAGNWQQSGGGWTAGDFDGSGKVDLTDLTILAGNWQGTFSGFQAAMASFPQFAGLSVPEPASLAVLGMGMVGLLLRRGRRTKRAATGSAAARVQ